MSKFHGALSVCGDCVYFLPEPKRSRVDYRPYTIHFGSCDITGERCDRCKSCCEHYRRGRHEGTVGNKEKIFFGSGPAAPKPVICVELNRWFPSLGAAARAFGRSSGALGYALEDEKLASGGQRRFCGYHWRFAREGETENDECREAL